MAATRKMRPRPIPRDRAASLADKLKRLRQVYGLAAPAARPIRKAGPRLTRDAEPADGPTCRLMSRARSLRDAGYPEQARLVLHDWARYLLVEGNQRSPPC